LALLAAHAHTRAARTHTGTGTGTATTRQGQQKVRLSRLSGNAGQAHTLQNAPRLPGTSAYSFLVENSINYLSLWRFLTDFGGKSRHLVVSANRCDRIATASEILRLPRKREASAARKYQKCAGKYRSWRIPHRAAVPTIEYSSCTIGILYLF